MNDIMELATIINHLKHDLRAEVIAAEVIENGLSPAEVVIIPDGSFGRKYSRDITTAEVIKSENGQTVLGIHVSRDGLYDSLPEAVFHDQSSEPLISGHEMAKLSKKQKTEEKEARLFFLPFENEIFYHRIQIEREERKILHRFNENLFDDIYPQFWKLDRSLPKKLVSRFVLILHMIHKILGNNELIAQCLGIIIDEEVHINITRSKQPGSPAGHPRNRAVGLGSAGLGENFICGEYVSDTDPGMEFVIGPLKNSSIENYLENGSYSKFLSAFYSFVVPVEMDPLTTIKISDDKQQFNLTDGQSSTILGFNSGI